MIKIPKSLLELLPLQDAPKLETFAGHIEPVYDRVHDHFPDGNDHGARHIDRVLNYFSMLLTSQGPPPLTADEIFIATSALIAHDIGMPRGRDGHGKTGAEIWSELRSDFGYITLNNNHVHEIIAQCIAHHSSSARLEDIPESSTIGSQPVRTRAVAAIVRLSDEIDEDARRASPFLLNFLSIAAESNFFWKFNEAIPGIRRAGESLLIELSLPSVDALTETVTLRRPDNSNATVEFADAMSGKLTKLTREVFYCSRHLPESMKLRRVILRATVAGRLQQELSIPSDWLEQSTHGEEPRPTILSWLTDRHRRPTLPSAGN